MDTKQTPRALTHDEQKAAAAAFAGRSFNPAWSQSAKVIYEGLVRALPGGGENQIVPSSLEVQAAESSAIQATTLPPILPPDHDIQKTAAAELSPQEADETVKKLMASRQEAINGGMLIDVTPDAQKVGLTFKVTVTRPLWDNGIAPNEALSEEDRADRLRDVLMAFRLKLSSMVTLSPLIDFPAMLALPPGAVPQPVPLFALIQADEQNRAMVTLLLPNEVSPTIIPMN